MCHWRWCQCCGRRTKMAAALKICSIGSDQPCSRNSGDSGPNYPAKKLVALGWKPAVSRISNPQVAPCGYSLRLEVGATAGWKPALRLRRQDTSPELRWAALSQRHSSVLILRGPGSACVLTRRQTRRRRRWRSRESRFRLRSELRRDKLAGQIGGTSRQDKGVKRAPNAFGVHASFVKRACCDSLQIYKFGPSGS